MAEGSSSSETGAASAGVAASRVRGSLLGMACGDAVGTTVEFSPPRTFNPVKDMTGGGPFGLRAGQWTDDTSLGLCLAESLIETGKFEMVDQLERYCRWFHDGHLSSNGRCFDIGNTTRGALGKFTRNRRNPFAGPIGENTAGNGSLMRLCAAPLAFWKTPHTAMDVAGLSSSTTHGAPQAVSACRYFGGLLVGCMQGVSKDQLLSKLYCPVPGYWEKTDRPLHHEVLAVASGSFKELNPPAIKGSGYVVKTLEAALWAFYHTDDFKSGCLKVVNLGDDADTTAAVYGQLAGAFYGEDGIPEKWRTKCFLTPLIRLMGNELASMADYYGTYKLADSFPVDGAPVKKKKVAVDSDDVIEGLAEEEGRDPAPEPYAASVEYGNVKVKGYDALEKELHAIIDDMRIGQRDEQHAEHVARLTGKHSELPDDAKSEELLGSMLRIV